MRVNEIFYSIDGEGITAGAPSVFIRLAGCNLKCSYCDTSYALSFSDGEEKTISEIIEEIKKYNCKNITLTGGEPLIHKDIDKLICKLVSSDYKVNIETNGSIDIKPYLLDNVVITMDWKTPTSKEEKRMRYDNLLTLRQGDVLKIVMSDEDKDYVRNFIRDIEAAATIFLSPVFNKIELSQLAEFTKELYQYNHNIRLQLQLHKYIWDPQERGV